MTATGKGDPGPLSFTEVGEVLRLVDQLDCDTFELEYGDLRISLRRGGQAGPVNGARPVAVAADVPGAALLAGLAAERDGDPPGPGMAGPAGDAPGGPGVVVAAPMTGTFYRSPAPGDPPFVQPGDEVKAGQAIALIEVMKLFSELRAEVDGTVARIDAEDRCLVEYGQPLMWIEPR